MSPRVIVDDADPAFCAGIDLKEAAREGEASERAVFADTHARVGILLEQRRAAVTERNRRQVRTGP